MAYHPNYFNENDTNTKRLDCKLRLKTIKDVIVDGGTLLDIGCNGGYYSFGLLDTCFSVVGVDHDKELIDKCNQLKEKHLPEDENISFKHGDALKHLKDMMNVDTCLYLSIHHHILAKYGWEEANNFIRKLSMHSSTMMFDMGQKNENCPEHKWNSMLPKTNNQKEWLMQYLLDNTEYTDVEVVGSSIVHGVERHLWMLAK